MEAVACDSQLWEHLPRPCFPAHSLGLLLCDICLCAATRCPGDANLGYDPIQAALTKHPQSNQRVTWARDETELGAVGLPELNKKNKKKTFT